MSKGITSGDMRKLQKWLALASILVSLGLLPKAWQKSIATAGSIVWLINSS
jgi:hypothetical protein